MKGKSSQRTQNELQQAPPKWWLFELDQKEAELSVVERLLYTQDQFIAILALTKPDLKKVFQLIEVSNFPANLFLKYLVTLTGFDVKVLQQLNRVFTMLFPSGKLVYLWERKQREYHFIGLPVAGDLTEAELEISGKYLFKKSVLSGLLKDVIALLLFGGFSSNKELAQILARCKIGSYLSKPAELNALIRQCYIWVNPISSKSQANSIKLVMLDYVREYLMQHLKIPDLSVIYSGQLPRSIYTDQQTGKLLNFDLIVTDGIRHVAIEICSEIASIGSMRIKNAQARAKFELVKASGHRIAYVIDGADNFRNAYMLKNVYSHSHCTGTFSSQKMDALCTFLTSYFNHQNRR